MILVSAIVPVLTVCLVLLFIILIRRFLSVRSKLPVLGLQNGISHLTGKRRWLAVAGVLIFLASFGARVSTKLWSPNMLMVFNYEEAARGQNPNTTRFNESDILSDRVLEAVIQRGGLQISPERLAEMLTLSTRLDAEKLDVTQESSLKISTEYWVHCSEKVSLYHTNPKTVLNLLADVYWEDFIQNYAENDSVLDLSFDELEGMEYLDVKDYLQMHAYKLKNYLPMYSSASSSFCAAADGETFASLSQKIDNFIKIELERYEAFVLENSLSIDKTTYQSRMQYANRLLDISRKQDMASYDVRIETINMYNAFMTRFVLIPTYDTDKEFYMSKTKVGVDYFADEAKEHLESATKLVEEMEHNSYASDQIGKNLSSSNAYAQADERIEELKNELINLSAQCRQLCSAYVKEKRDGYIQVSFSSPSMAGEAGRSFLFTLLFVAALGGIAILDPFYKACREDIPVGGAVKQALQGKTRKKSKKSGKGAVKPEGKNADREEVSP